MGHEAKNKTGISARLNKIGTGKRGRIIRSCLFTFVPIYCGAKGDMGVRPTQLTNRR